MTLTAAEDPYFQRISRAASDAMQHDPSIDNVLSEMRRLHAELLAAGRPRSGRGDIGPMTRLTAARVTRSAVVRVIAHRFAMNVAPIAATILDGDGSIVERLIHDGDLAPVMGVRAGVSTDWRRVLRGDDARLFTAASLIAHEPAVQALHDLPAGLRVGCLTAGIWLERAAEQVMTHYRDAAPPPDPADHDRRDFVIGGPAERGNWFRRFVRAMAYRTPKDADAFLLNNYVSSVEHLTYYVADVTRSFTRLGARSQDMLRTFLVEIGTASVPAFAPNLPLGEAEYDDRYVWQRSFGPGRREPRRRPMFEVHRSDAGVFTVGPSPGSIVARYTRHNRQLCPGPDVVPAVGPAERTATARLRAAMLRVAGDDDRAAALRRGYSTIDVLAALTCAVSRVLLDLGVISFTAAELARHLGADKRTTGAYIFQRPPVIPAAG